MRFTIVFDEVGTLDTTDIETAFQACEQTQLVSAVLDAETGYVLYGQLPDWMLTPEEASARAKAEKETREKALAWRKAHNTEEEAKRKERVGGITRASACHGVKQYDNAVIIPMRKEWAILSRADIGDYFRTMEFKNNAVSIFEQKAKRTWCNRPFYDEIRLYHNGILVRFSVNGHELTM